MAASYTLTGLADDISIVSRELDALERERAEIKRRLSDIDAAIVNALFRRAFATVAIGRVHEGDRF